MQGSPKRCGIISFPKSGNTWFREIVRAVYGSNESVKKVAPDIYEDGIDGLRMSSSNGQSWVYYKTHSAQETLSYKGTPVRNDLVIYIVRNPLDVFCSQLNYLLQGFDANRRGGIQIHSESMEDAVGNGMMSEYLSAFTVFGTLMPFFIDARSWMQNVRYWTELAKKDDRVIVIKYEDMIKDLGAALAPFLDKVGLTSVDIAKVFSVADSRTQDGGRFYWSRSDGSFLKYLTRPQIDRFLAFHGELISASGYDDYYRSKLQATGT